MRRLWIACLCAIAVLSLGVVPASAEDKAIEGELQIGGAWTLDDIDRDDSAAQGGAEYNSLFDRYRNLDLGGDLSVRKGVLSFDGNARYLNVDEQAYGADLSLDRILVYKTDYNRFIHHLDHDTLSNLEAHIFKNTSGTPDSPGAPVGLGVADLGAAGTIGSALVYHTDHAIGDMYSETHSAWNNRLTFNLPMLPELKFGFDHRYEKRHGCAQSLTMSKCSACHVEGFSKGIDEVTNDFTPRASLQLGTMGLELSYMHRDFQDKSDEMSQVYNGLAVPTHYDLFTNRLQFDNLNGALPFDQAPDSSKDSFTLKGRWDMDPHNVLTLAGVYSRSTNRQTDGAYEALTGNFGDDLTMDSTAVMAKWHSRLTNTLSVNVHGKYQTLDNDDVYVNVNDDLYLLAFAPDSTAAANKDLATAYGLPAGYWDYTRKSGYNLDIVTAGLDASWRVLRGVTLRGAYEFHYENRDNYEAHDVPEDTSEHTFKLAGDWRVNHRLKLGLDYRLSLIDDAYALNHAVCAPDVFGVGYAGPGTDLYTYARSYYPAVYSQRQGSRSNQPSLVHELKFKGNWTPLQRLSTSLYAKYRLAENNEVDGNDWQQDLFTAGLNLVVTPTEKMTFAAGYNYFYDKYQSMYCIALYDG